MLWAPPRFVATGADYQARHAVIFGSMTRGLS